MAESISHKLSYFNALEQIKQVCNEQAHIQQGPRPLTSENKLVDLLRKCLRAKTRHIYSKRCTRNRSISKKKLRDRSFCQKSSPPQELVVIKKIADVHFTTMHCMWSEIVPKTKLMPDETQVDERKLFSLVCESVKSLGVLLGIFLVVFACYIL